MKTFILLISFLSINISFASFGKMNWEKIQSKDQIEMFESKNYKGSSVSAFQVRMTLPMHFDQILAFMINEKNKLDWLPDTTLYKVLEKNPKRSVIYKQFKRVKPFKQRDLVFEITHYLDVINRSFNLNMKSVDHPLSPPVDGGHRADLLAGQLQFKMIAKGKTELILNYAMDLSGWIPAMLGNVKQKDWLYDYFKALREAVKGSNLPIPREIQKLDIIFFQT